VLSATARVGTERASFYKHLEAGTMPEGGADVLQRYKEFLKEGHLFESPKAPGQQNQGSKEDAR
jgi:hypothetical protein